MKPRKHQAALTLIEMLAVVVIIGIVALIVVRRLVLNSRDSRQNACFQNRSVINAAIEYYYLENGKWPNSLADIRAMPNILDDLPVCPVSGEPYTIDAATHRISGHTPDNH